MYICLKPGDDVLDVESNRESGPSNVPSLSFSVSRSSCEERRLPRSDALLTILGFRWPRLRLNSRIVAY